MATTPPKNGCSTPSRLVYCCVMNSTIAWPAVRRRVCGMSALPSEFRAERIEPRMVVTGDVPMSLGQHILPATHANTPHGRLFGVRAAGLRGRTEEVARGRRTGPLAPTQVSRLRGFRTTHHAG